MLHSVLPTLGNDTYSSEYPTLGSSLNPTEYAAENPYLGGTLLCMGFSRE